MKTPVFLVLLLHLSFTEVVAVDDQNKVPCMLSNRTSSYTTFLKRHILEGAPGTDDQNAWESLLRSKKFCLRPTQSFLPESERQRVEAVCSPSGGKVFKGNMCISKESFSFITVRVVSGTCGIKRIDREQKHLILACEKLRNVCQPVHFEGNPQNLVPDQNRLDCGLSSPPSGSRGVRAVSALVGVLSMLLVFRELWATL